MFELLQFVVDLLFVAATAAAALDFGVDSSFDTSALALELIVIADQLLIRMKLPL